MLKNAFDAVVQSLLVGFRDWVTYHDYVNNASTPVLNFVKMVSKHGTSHKVYKERASILNNIFPSKSATIDCACNISE